MNKYNGYSVRWSEIFGDRLALSIVDKNAAEIVVTDSTHHYRFLADVQESAFHSRDLQFKKKRKKEVNRG